MNFPNGQLARCSSRNAVGVSWSSGAASARWIDWLPETVSRHCLAGLIAIYDLDLWIEGKSTCGDVVVTAVIVVVVASAHADNQHEVNADADADVGANAEAETEPEAEVEVATEADNDASRALALIAALAEVVVAVVVKGFQSCSSAAQRSTAQSNQRSVHVEVTA